MLLAASIHEVFRLKHDANYSRVASISSPKAFIVYSSECPHKKYFIFQTLSLQMMEGGKRRKEKKKREASKQSSSNLKRKMGASEIHLLQDSPCSETPHPH